MGYTIFTLFGGGSDFNDESIPWVETGSIELGGEKSIKFGYRSSHPFLAEHSYRLSLIDGSSIRNVPITPNIGGDIEVAIFSLDGDELYVSQSYGVDRINWSKASVGPHNGKPLGQCVVEIASGSQGSLLLNECKS